jgi:hypothetical protein
MYQYGDTGQLDVTVIIAMVRRGTRTVITVDASVKFHGNRSQLFRFGFG